MPTDRGNAAANFWPSQYAVLEEQALLDISHPVSLCKHDVSLDIDVDRNGNSKLQDRIEGKITSTQ